MSAAPQTRSANAIGMPQRHRAQQRDEEDGDGHRGAPRTFVPGDPGAEPSPAFLRNLPILVSFLDLADLDQVLLGNLAGDRLPEIAKQRTAAAMTEKKMPTL